MTRRNIIWTNEECKLLARHIVNAEMEAQHRGVRLTHARAVRDAMEVELPRSRQRDSRFPNPLWTTLEPFIVKERQRVEKAHSMEKKALLRVPTSPEPEFAPEPAPTQLEIKLNDLMQQLCTGLAKAISWEVANTVTNITKNMVIPVIAGEVKQALAAMTQPVSTEGLEAAVTRALEQHDPIVVTTTPLPEGADKVSIAPRDRMPRVLIVGLLGQQEEDVSRAFKGDIDLTFIKTSSNMSTNDFHLKLVNKDLIVLMTRFSSHWHDEQIKRAGVPVMRITGGLSMLKAWLQKWFNGEVGIAGMPARDHHSQGDTA